MAAYAALVSLMHIIRDIQEHPFPPVSLDKEQVESLTEIATFLQEFLDGYNSPIVDSDEADPLEICIADAAYAAEDVIESNIVDQILPRGAENDQSDHEMGFLNCFRSRKEPKNDGETITTSFELYEGLQKVIQDMGLIKKEALKKKAAVVEDELRRQVSASASLTRLKTFDEIMDKLAQGQLDRQVIPIVGTDGIGKTTLARSIYAQSLINEHFDIYAWATISQHYDMKEILRQLLSQANKEGSEPLKSSNTREDELGVALYKCLSHRRFLIVLDDMWSIEAWEKMQHFFPDNDNSSRIMVTTRLPVETWDSIRRNGSLVVNLENDEHCLRMCYYHLPVHLKPCFLYMGVFEECCAIRASIIIKLWVSEGFLKPISGKSLETVAKEYLKELVDRNLILVHNLGSTGNVKYYRIHSLLRDLCLREAEKQRFYHVVGLHSPQGTYRQRRIVIPRNTSKKKVVDSLESMPHARSYISDDESVPRLPNLRFLRIYESYDRYTNDRTRFLLRNMFELVNSRYLNVGVHHRLELTSSINLLWNLQTLIVAHPRKVTAPVEIWKMPRLRHLHFCEKGLYLPDPSSSSDNNNFVMENLQTLKGVRNFKCDEEMVRRIPNIMKLGLKYDKGIGLRGDYYCFANFECLYKLESLTCKDSRLEDYLDMFTFPHSLRKLSLEAKLFVWQDVLEKIGSLPLLQKLTLLGGQFRRGEWETVEGRFLSLKSLKLVANLECWRVESSSHFPCLERLFLGGLMEDIPTVIGHISTLQSIVLFHCSESVAKSAKKLVAEQEELQGENLSFKVSVLLLEKNEALQSLANPNFQVLI